MVIGLLVGSNVIKVIINDQSVIAHDGNSVELEFTVIVELRVG